MNESLIEPYGCTHCGIPRRMHGRRWNRRVGMHPWEFPTQEQIKARMLARRAARKAGA